MGTGNSETKDEKKFRVFMKIIELLKELDKEQRENVLSGASVFYQIKI